MALVRAGDAEAVRGAVAAAAVAVAGRCRTGRSVKGQAAQTFVTLTQCARSRCATSMVRMDTCTGTTLTSFVRAVVVNVFRGS